MNCVTDMTLLEGGDRVLVAVSGGADSVGCIAALFDILKRSPIKFQLGAVTVDPMVPEYNPEPLKEYFH